MKLPGLSGKDSVNLWPFEQVIWLQVFFSVKVVLIIGSSSFVRIHEHFCGKCWKGDVFFCNIMRCSKRVVKDGVLDFFCLAQEALTMSNYAFME